jgi:hypothetical protein
MDARPAFTLRFRRERTHRALRHAAEQLGVSMNELAERAIEHELAVIGSELEEKLRRTLDLLGPYRQEGLEADVAAFARAEVTEDDPLHAVAAESRADSLGVGAAFADPVE